jgi:penicillin amidase
MRARSLAAVPGTKWVRAASGRLEFPQTSTFGASGRHVADLGDKTVLFVIAPGQSGHPLSPHYRDLVQKWRTGEMLPLALQPPAVVTKTPSRTNATFRPLGPKIGDANGQ